MSDPNEETDAAPATETTAEPEAAEKAVETSGQAAKDDDANATAEAGASPEADASPEAGATDEVDADANAEAARAAEQVARTMALFADGDGGVRFARWSTPIRAEVFGLDAASRDVVLRVFAEAAALIGRAPEEASSESGDASVAAPATLTLFVVSEWRALGDAPGLDRLVDDPSRLAAMLEADGRDVHRLYDLDESAGLTRMVVVARAGEALTAMSAQAAALGLAAQSLLAFAPNAFVDDAPVAVRRSGRGVLKQWFERLLNAAYADDAPNASTDPAAVEAIAAAARGAGRPDGRRRRSKRGPSKGEAVAVMDAVDDASEAVVDAMDGAPS